MNLPYVAHKTFIHAHGLTITMLLSYSSCTMPNPRRSCIHNLPSPSQYCSLSQTCVHRPYRWHKPVHHTHATLYLQLQYYPWTHPNFGINWLLLLVSLCFCHYSSSPLLYSLFTFSTLLCQCEMIAIKQMGVALLGKWTHTEEKLSQK